jgi:hypothetical protein
MKFYEIDKTNFPIVTIRMHNVEPSAQDFKIYLQEHLEMLSSTSEPVILIMDISNGKSLSSELRIEQGNWNKKNYDLLRSKMKGMVFVTKSLVMQFVIKAVCIIQKLPVDYLVVRDFSEAMNWAEGQLGRRSAA